MFKIRLIVDKDGMKAVHAFQVASGDLSTRVHPSLVATIAAKALADQSHELHEASSIDPDKHGLHLDLDVDVRGFRPVTPDDLRGFRNGRRS